MAPEIRPAGGSPPAIGAAFRSTAGPVVWRSRPESVGIPRGVATLETLTALLEDRVGGGWVPAVILLVPQLRTGRSGFLGEPDAHRAGPATLVCVDGLKALAASADHARRERLNQRLRQAYLEGAEEDSRRRLGRGLTAEELERVLWHYPGDAIERWSPETDGERGGADDHGSR